jgi:hypothetical protein
MASSTTVSVLQIQVHEASGLRNVAWMGFNQDPYVVVRALPSNTEVKTGHIWGGGVNPKWDPSKHNSQLTMKLKSSDHTLVFELKNKNTLIPDELIGSGILDMGMIIDGTYGTSSPMPLPLQTGGGTLVVTVFKKMTDDDEDLQRALLISANGGGGSSSNSSSSSSGGDFSSMFSSSSSSSTPLHRSSSAAGGGEGKTLGGSSAPLTAEERRAAVAAAAEARQGNWRQGGSTDPSKQASLNERRIKEDLIGKIEACYTSRGDEAPFGLRGSTVDALQKHLKVDISTFLFFFFFFIFHQKDVLYAVVD